MVFRSQSPSASSSKQTAQFSSCVLYLFSVFILYLGMKLSKWLMSFSSEDLPSLPSLPLLHLKIKTARVSKKMKRKMPPRMNRNLVKRSQKSKTSISSCRVMSIVPSFANFMPRMKFSERPFGCEPKTIRGVLSLVQPSLIYQSRPPGSELLLSMVEQSPLSCQTSMDQLLRLAVVWQSVKIRTTYASTSWVILKNVQSLLVMVVETSVPSTISQAVWVHPPMYPASHAQQLFSKQCACSGQVLFPSSPQPRAAQSCKSLPAAHC